jgi:tetratricopeptide (TPR) repeat protein
LTGKGFCLINLEKVDEGIKLIYQAIEKDSKLAINYFYLGLYYLQVNNVDKYKQNIEKALDIDPEYEDAIKEKNKYSSI